MTVRLQRHDIALQWSVMADRNLRCGAIL